MPANLLIIGISGVTCGGKTTLANELKKIIPSTMIISQDNYFFDNNDPRHTWIEELNHVNYDIISSLDMERMHQDVTEIIDKYNIVRCHCRRTKNGINRKMSELLNTQLKNTDCDILILEGFCIFNYKPLSDLCCLKYYFTLSKEDCYKRRSQRVYEPPDCPGYFEKCAWPEYLNLYQYVKDNVVDTVYLDGSLPQPIGEILIDIYNILVSLPTNK